MPTRSVYPIPLPAPSKSACIKLLNAFIRDVDQAGATAATSYMAPPGQGLSSSRKKSPLIGGPSGTSPGSPVNSPGSPVRTTNLALPVDQTPIENYTHELISEWLTREKREYMAKNKWAKSGRDQLHKDLLDIETALCVSGKGAPSKHTPELLPVFLLLRRTYSLPATTLPNSVIGSAYEMLPMPPEPDGVPLAEPTVSSATAQLYVNPRLPDTAALDAIEELLESEREKGMNADVSVEKTISWLLGQVEQIQKRVRISVYCADPSFRMGRMKQFSSKQRSLLLILEFGRMCPPRAPFPHIRLSTVVIAGQSHPQSRRSMARCLPYRTRRRQASFTADRRRFLRGRAKLQAWPHQHQATGNRPLLRHSMIPRPLRATSTRIPMTRILKCCRDHAMEPSSAPTTSPLLRASRCARTLSRGRRSLRC